MPVFAPAVDASWLPGVVCKAISDAEGFYGRYCHVLDSGEGLRTDVPADDVDKFRNKFTREAL